MRYGKMRGGFSILVAIAVLVAISALAAYVFSFSGKTVKATTAQFQAEQAKLYAKSYTQYAILAVTGNNRSTACLQDIGATIGTPNTGNGYRVRVHISYIATPDVDLTQCNSVRILSSSVQTAESPLSILVDVYVDYKDPDDLGGPWRTIHRRTIQKI